MLNSFFLLIISFLLFFSNQVFGETSSIQIPDSTVYQGNSVLIPIYGTFSQSVLNKPIDIIIQIPKNRIFLQGIIKHSQSIISCSEIVVKPLISSNPSMNEFSISCKDGLRDSSGLLCFVQCEILAGKEVSSRIAVLSINIENEFLTVNQKGGLLSFPEPTVIPAGQEGLEINSPNPFQYTTEIPYYIIADSDITFSLFATNGKALKIFPTTFTKAGRHIFNLIVDNPTDFASGVYILRLHTPRGLYHLSMVHKK